MIRAAVAAPEAPTATSTMPDTKSLYMPLQNGSDVRGVAVEGEPWRCTTSVPVLTHRLPTLPILLSFPCYISSKTLSKGKRHELYVLLWPGVTGEKQTLNATVAYFMGCGLAEQLAQRQGVSPQSLRVSVS